MRKRIGEFLVEKKVLTPAQVEEILQYAKSKNLRFGDAGLELGILTEEKLVAVFGKSHKTDFFHIEAKYFPKQTKDVIPLPLLLKNGVLPLGSKIERKIFRSRKLLNLGLLDPSESSKIDEVWSYLKTSRQEFDGVKAYLILADQMLDVLEEVYGVTENQLEKTPDLDSTLKIHVRN